MELISAQELNEMLDRGADFRLVMVLGEWEYQAKHIPGSLRINTIEEGLDALDPDDEIVVYDSGPDCVASRRTYRIMKEYGYEHVRCYSGGLEEWERLGHRLEGGEVRRG